MNARPASLAILVGASLLLHAGRLGAQTTRPARLTAVTSQIDGIMSTDATLVAVVPPGGEPTARQALSAARAALLDVDKCMSSHRADSELARLNDADVGREIALSAELLSVLRQARDYAAATDGAFDVTCRPLLELWKNAAGARHMPTDDELDKARALLGWRHFRLSDAGATKLTAGASIDLGGIAKKHAIDRAAEAMRRAGARGGFVNVGGDVRCFGAKTSVDDQTWNVGVRDPFDKAGRLLAVLRVRDAAVCTSGNYERFVVIEGRRFSHIVDPRTGRPADAAPSVTVAGPDAVQAGVWATALCVLGPDGLNKLPANLHAVMVTGQKARFKLHLTPGVRDLLGDLLPDLPQAKSAATTPD